MENLNNAVLSSAHTLIVGATGCGKSVLIHQVICEAIRRPLSFCELFLIDLKGGLELCEYENLPHVTRFADNTDEALAVLEAAVQIMQRRQQSMRQRGVKMYEGRDLYVRRRELACGV